MRRWRIGAEKAWTVIFAPDLIEYAFVVISLSAAKLVKLLIFAPLFNAQKKHVLNYFVPVSVNPRRVILCDHSALICPV